MRSITRTSLPSLAILVSLLCFGAICAGLFSNSLPYLDDRYLILMQKQMDMWAPTHSFQSMWGSYRLFYTTLMGPVYALGEHLWIARTIGLSLHMADAVLLYFILGKLRWQNTTRLFAFGLYLFFPFSLEAVAWPSNISQYPFAPFLMLSGIALAISWGEKYWRLFSGAVLIGLSVWVHEQVGPLIILFLIVLGAGLPRRPAVLLACISLAIIAANFALIYVTRGSNLRLTGPDAGSLANAWKHIGYAPNMIRTTPLGDFFYATGGMDSLSLRWAIAVMLIGVLVGFIAFRAREGVVVSAWREPEIRWFWPLILVMTIGAYMVSLIPTLMTPIPWHTGRTIYIPFIAFTICAGIVVELVQRAASLARPVRAAVAALACFAVAWSAFALRAEAKAFELQTKMNVERSDNLAARIGKEIYGGKAVLMVGGYRYGDTTRPLFGEHFTSMTQSEIRAAFDLPVHESDQLYPAVIARAHWSHICQAADGRAAVDPQLLADARIAEVLQNADRTLFAVWDEDRGWLIQRPGEPAPKFPAHMPHCPS